MIIGDNSIELPKLPNDYIDLTITSPPYKDIDGFKSIDFSSLFRELYRIHKKNTLFFLNFGHLKEEKERPFKLMLAALQEGWKLNDTITWVKPQYSPIQGRKRLNNLTEFIFILYKGKMPALDRLSIGVPYEDKGNIGRYSKVDLKCRGNVWKVGYKTITSKSQKLHPDRFPLDIPKMCIKLANLSKEAVILDPFGGSGTTEIAAAQLGFQCISFEKNPKYLPIFENRCLNV